MQLKFFNFNISDKLSTLQKSLFLILIFVFPNITLNVIIANSKLEICTNSSTKNFNSTDIMNKNSSDTDNFYNQTPKLTCNQKLIVSLAIDNSKSADTDYLEAYIYEVDSENNSLNQNSNNSKQKLLNPLRINISKTPVYIEYPSVYFQTFNYKPTEQVIISDVFSCEDGDLAQSPTCGWTLNSLNQRIPFSQGFCCKCDFAQIIGINNTDRNRGNTCKFLNLSSGSATAHCLKYDNLWWSAYQVNNYQIVYEIDIFVSYMDDNLNKNRKIGIKRNNENFRKHLNSNLRKNYFMNGN